MNRQDFSDQNKPSTKLISIRPAISKLDEEQFLYPIFYGYINNQPFLTTSIRKEIINEWQLIKPNTSLAALKMRLFTMERAYFENFKIMNREGWRNKILLEGEAVKEFVYNSNVSPDKKAKAIIDQNRLSAQVAQLDNLPPSIEIKIQTNIDETDLAIKMNKGYFDKGESTDENNSAQ